MALLAPGADLVPLKGVASALRTFLSAMDPCTIAPKVIEPVSCVVSLITKMSTTLCVFVLYTVLISELRLCYIGTTYAKKPPSM